ncbi:GDP-mannose 4,6-dehydratase [Cerasicoccus arenae]|uniref:GDP-mannose 4,6-dehydratase n=1 Tax=Cerasicoccus arenae TaxID=424488 RepID=A0A8J3GEY2_9BACT|nr:GDP-mannose 4,6-dehydratase [Cerasicoccus arenae]MBK1858095.1 GDP-mannose 4,6-dehydratase [Cerasicoccus arenae]GHC07052.1 GDP-mannose 4,6-dehydratase [Cerasicoccus arenae]
MSKQAAFITGITGQDGSYLCEMLLEKGYEVHGLVHRPESLQSGNIRHLVENEAIFKKQLFLHTGAFEDATHLRRIINKARPAEFYHLAGQSSPRLSLELPEATVESIGMATLRLLEIIRDLDEPPRFLYASSSEVFGSPVHSPQDEQTPVRPTTPYGAAKSFSQEMSRIYRTAYSLPTCSAILYNHESPRRRDTFVTMKIARAAARIKLGLQKELELGSLQGRRDWGWAPDYVRGMWMILQSDTVDDFILATGKLHSVEQLVEAAFNCVDLNWRDYVKHDPALVMTVEPYAPCGNPAKAKRLLGWQNTVPFEEMIQRLVESQLDRSRA